MMKEDVQQVLIIINQIEFDDGSKCSKCLSDHQSNLSLSMQKQIKSRGVDFENDYLDNRTFTIQKKLQI